MAAAAGPGGAEMGHGATGGTSAKTESLATEGTWTPTFGVQGLDVSYYQAGVNWQEQWNMGARFAYIKATEGNYYSSPSFAAQYQGARNVGMIRGAYHFANPMASSGADQARIFVQGGGRWSADGYTLPPVLDFETNPYAGRTINGFYQGNTCYDMSASQLAGWARDFGNTMLSLTGRMPVIYTNTSWWRQCVGDAAGFGDFPLWTAYWPSSASNYAGPLPSSWSSYNFWQYSESGPFAGDSNVWNGSYAELSAFANAGIPQAAVRAIADLAAVSPGLGRAVTGLKTGLNGGVSQGYENGAIYWTAANGAHISSGVIRDAWGAQGWEAGVLGYPTTDVRTAANGAQSQGYQNGAIYWTAATGARISTGAIRDAWGAQGWEAGPLGYPTTDVKTAPNGAKSQGYENGAIYWTAANGARISSGVIRDAWGAQGWEAGPLGYPTTDVRTAPNGAKSQGYENGAIYWTAATGARISTGAIRDAWAAQGWESGPLGYPTTDIRTGPKNGLSQGYENGAIYWTAATGARTTSGVIRDAWAAQGWEAGPLGYPTTDVRTAPNGAKSQGYENGAIYWTAATGARISSGVIRDAWAAQGWESGPLGYPTTDVKTGPNSGLSQGYENGAIYWTAATGARSTSGVIRDAWAAQGAESGPLGYPTTDVRTAPNGAKSQGYENGAIYWTAATGAHISSGAIRDAWAAQGWEAGPLGYPTTDVRTAPNGAKSQGYQNGAIYWTAANGARISSGVIRDAWAAQGWESGPLGYPTTDIRTAPNGAKSQGYENGAIYWTAATGAHVSSGAIRDAWAAQGWETGPLGYPTTDVKTAPNGAKSQGYQNGAIYWTTTTGAQLSPNGPIRNAWGAQGWESGPLGYPTGPQTCTAAADSCNQPFTGGRITWTLSRGAFIG
ncbi:GH25 family lysozyme [Arthrobacter sp. NicSoilB4]|uniref:GH25 family lysozyme n=1 Tax=Arthrobacter sp. NicSoilB4 TaxID=2830997 RepID=UPI001CC483D1|nr:GH25 family lysozyme [Arthrobacter sp. NicSoilB4]